MGKMIEGVLDSSKLKFAIIVSRFNELVSKGLLEGAKDCLKRHGTKDENIDVVMSPGSFEIPVIAKKLAVSGGYNAIICLGAVIRGETVHFEYVAAEAAKGIAKVSLDTGVPISFGILTTENVEQALERAGAKPGNKGFDAAMSAVEMGNLMRALRA